MNWRDGPAPRALRSPKRVSVAKRTFALCDMGRPQAALDLLGREGGTSPDDHRLHMVRAHAYRKLERYPEAEAAIMAAIALKPDEGNLHGQLAHILLEMNKPAQAKDPALQAIRLRPNGVLGHLCASEAFRRCGEHAQALDFAQRCVQIRGAGGGRQALIGRVLLSYERWGEAEDLLRQAAAQRPELLDIFLALSLIPQGRAQEAAQALGTALRNHPSARLARLLWDRLGTWRDSERTLREEIAQSPERRQPVMDLAGLLISQGRLTEAAATLTHVVEMHPDDDAARVQIGQVSARLRAIERGDAPEEPVMLVVERELREELARQRAVS